MYIAVTLISVKEWEEFNAIWNTILCL